MQDKSVLTVATVVVVACIISWIPAVAQKETAAPAAPATAKPAPVQVNGAAPPAPADDLAFLGAEPVVVNVDPKVVDNVTGFSIQNTSKATSYTPTAKLQKFGFVSDSGTTITTDKVLSVDGVPTEKMDAGDTAHLLLRLKKDAPPVRAGTYDGMLVVSANGKDVKRKVQVTIPDFAGTIAPLLTKLNIRLYRKVPFFGDYFAPGDSFAPAIPLQTPVDPDRAGLTRRPMLTVLSRDLVGTVPLSWDGDYTIKSMPKLGLKFGSIPFAGKYDGTVNFGSADRTVTVSLTTTDLFVWPLAILLIAVTVAIFFKNFLGGGKQILQWRADLLAAKDAVRQAREAFAKEVPVPSASYSIQPDVDTQVNTILADIAILKGNFSGALDPTNPLFIFVSSEIPVLGATAELWVLFGKQLKALGDLRAAVPVIQLKDGIEDPPAVLTQTDVLLKGKDVLIADLAGLQTQVVNQTVFLAQWIGLAKTADKIRSQVMSMVTSDAAVTTAIAALNKSAVEALSDLFNVTGQDPVKNAAVADTVTALKKSLADLLINPGLQAPQGAGVQSAAHELESVAESSAITTARKRVESQWEWKGDLASIKKEIKKRDRALGILAYVLALVTGMTSQYYGHNFGTVSDYLGLILWAFASKITVDVLAGGLERFVGA